MDVICEETFIFDDCIIPSFCLNGQCQPATTREDGFVCHSEEWGSCFNGVCVKGSPPSDIFTGMFCIYFFKIYFIYPLQ